MVSIGNILYALLFGWWIALIYFIIGILCHISLICIPHGQLLFQLGVYFAWPFGKYLERIRMVCGTCFAHSFQSGEDEAPAEPVKVSESTSLLTETVTILNTETATVETPEKPKENVPSTLSIYMKFLRHRSCLELVEKMLFIVLFSMLRMVFYTLFNSATNRACTYYYHDYFMVFHIYDSNSQGALASIAHFAQVSSFSQGFRPVRCYCYFVTIFCRFPPDPRSDILLCTYQALNFYYYKYSVFGMNVIPFSTHCSVIVILFIRLFTICGLFHCVRLLHSWICSQVLHFCVCCVPHLHGTLVLLYWQGSIKV